MSSLMYHGVSEAEMREVIRTELRSDIDKVLAIEPPKNAPPKQAIQQTIAPVQMTLVHSALHEQLIALLDECRLTREDLADAAGITLRSVYRHLSGEVRPRGHQIAAYEKHFSKVLGREVRLQMSAKRQ
jgi:hypothetical protein